MKRKKRFLGILLSLVLVLGLMPGMSLTALAEYKPDEEANGTLLTTIIGSNYPAEGNIAKSFDTTDGVAHVEFTGTVFQSDDDYDGRPWYNNTEDFSLTVSAKEGYFITKCVFHRTKDDWDQGVTVYKGPFTAYKDGEWIKVKDNLNDNRGLELSEPNDKEGIAKIDVYGVKLSDIVYNKGVQFRKGDVVPAGVYFKDLYNDDAVSLKVDKTSAIYEMGWNDICLNFNLTEERVLLDEYWEYYRNTFQFREWDSSVPFVHAVAIEITDGKGTKEDPYVFTPIYPVTFNSDGGSTTPDTQEVMLGYKVTAPSTDPTKNRCTFGGWYNGNTKWDFEKDTINGGITLKAKWISHTVTYDGNGATGGAAPTDSSSPYPDKETVTVLGNTGNLEKTNCIFEGWNTQADGKGTDYSAGATFHIEANTTLYAKWKSLHEHDFTYSADGAAITATCSADGCTLPPSSEGGTDHVATLTIVAPTLTTYGGTGNAAATLTGLDAFNTATGKTIAATDIKYVGRDGTTYAESATAPTNAGKYTAKITLSGVKTSAGENQSVTASVDYEIAKADPDYTVPSDLTATYGQTLANVTLPTGWTWVDSSASVGNVATIPNTFKANFTPTDTTNYNVVENVDVSVLVSKADPVYTVGQLSAFRGQTLADVALPTADNGMWSWMDDTATTFNDIGTTTHFAKFTPNDTSNYNIIEDIEVQIQVTEKPLAVPATVTANNREYDGTEKPLVTVGNSTLVGGTMQYALGTATEATGTYTTSIPKATDIGTYYVWYKVTGDENHLDSAPACVTVTIKNGDQTAPAAPVVTKETVNSITVKTAKGVEYSLDGKHWQTSGVFSKLKAGTKYTVRARRAETANYNPSPVVKAAAKTLSYSNLLSSGLKINASGKKIAVKWGKVPGATAYDIYVQYCSSSYTKKATATAKGSATSIVITKVNGRAINTAANYKVYVVARNGKTVLGKSPSLHGVASGRKNVYTDPRGITLSKTALTLNKGKTASIGAKLTLVNSKLRQLSDNHAPALRYVSSDTRIATVNAKGQVTAKTPGLCYIYVLARTGLTRIVTVRVK